MATAEEEEFALLDAYVRRIDQAAYERLVSTLDVDDRLRRILAEAGGPGTEPATLGDRTGTRPTGEIRQT